MTARKICELRMGDEARADNGVIMERAAYDLYRRAWGRECPPGMVPFFRRIPGGKLDWWLVPSDIEVEWEVGRHDA